MTGDNPMFKSASKNQLSDGHDNGRIEGVNGAFPSRVKAGLIASALPFIQRYDGQTVVVKYGGNAMDEPEIAQSFACNIAFLNQAGVNPVVVHGGGPQISAALDNMGIESRFSEGLRVTDAETVKVVEMVLAGQVNKQIVSIINHEGELAVGLTGKDGQLDTVEPVCQTVKDPKSGETSVVDLGFVGRPVHVNSSILDVLAKSRMIPVIAPIAIGHDRQTYNVNADTFAGAVASSVGAKRLLFLTDVPGVYNKDGKLIDNMTVTEARAMIADGSISEGMIPKVKTCIEAVEGGVEGVVILDGKAAHSVVLELFTDAGVGTLITADKDDTAHTTNGAGYENGTGRRPPPTNGGGKRV